MLKSENIPFLIGPYHIVFNYFIQTKYLYLSVIESLSDPQKIWLSSLIQIFYLRFTETDH